MKQKIIQQGAEGIIILTKENQILKKRIKKSYRIKKLDEKIRKLRTRNETKIMKIASTKIPVPKIIQSDEKKNEIIMEFIDGKKLSENLNKFSLLKQKRISKQIGKNIGELHLVDIAHGDLTTSNMVLKNKKIYFIDFGLSFKNARYEDKAVDLHLFKQALESKHYKNWEKLFKKTLKGYSSSNKKEANKVFERLKKVEKRGRYKS
jgi:TP53 regulating kinase and related kinases